jgi:L-amino acid N-acyltransferase YncA
MATSAKKSKAMEMTLAFLAPFIEASMKSFSPELPGGYSAAMKIRPATHADLHAILDIYNDAVLHTTASYDYEPRTIEHRQAWFEDHVANNLPVFVAVDDSGKVVGWSALNRFHDRKGYQFTVENSVYVAADQRGRGVGKLLMPPLIEGAKSQGKHAILAAIDAQNEASIRLHAAFGFEQVAHLKQVGFKFGRWLDVVYLERLL